MGFRCLLFLLAACLSSPLTYADADRGDWFGVWSMDHDGHLGSFHVGPMLNCKAARCPIFDLYYVDQSGAKYSATADVLDDNGQHMQVTISFPDNPQVFSLYIFSFDKSKLAGTTTWGGRTFGVFATKAAQVSSTQANISLSQKPSLLPDGSIEVRSADGTVRSKRIGQCGWQIRYADGRVVAERCQLEQVRPVFPPEPPSESIEGKWLEGQKQELLAILRNLLGGAGSTDFQNYISNYENPPDPLDYKLIYYRVQAIDELTQVPN